MGIASCQVLYSGNGRYLTSQIAYYADDRGEREGDWYGEGASKLGLRDSIKHNDQCVNKLLQGRNAFTDEVLRRGGTNTRIYKDSDGNEKEYKPVTAFDLTLSAPKSLSVLWATSSEEKRQQLETAQQEAVRQTLSYIEANFCYIRTKEGKEQASLAAAVFQHSTSREGDPQLHTHALIFNIGQTDSSKSGALDSKFILKNIHEIGRVYENSLRGQLHEIGLQTVEKKLQRGTSFEIEDVSEKVCSHFSKRREQIEEHLTPESTSKDVQNIVLKTRVRKEKKVDREALFEESRKQAFELRFDPEKVWNKEKRIEKTPEQIEKEKQTELAKLKESVTRSLASIEPFRAIKERDIKAQFLKHSGGRFTLQEIDKNITQYKKEHLHQIGGELDRWKRYDQKQETKPHLRVKTNEGILLRKIKEQAKQIIAKKYRERVSDIYLNREQLNESREARHKATGKETASKLYTLKERTRSEIIRDSLYSIVRSKLIKPLQKILPEGKPLSHRYKQKQYEKSRKRYERRRNQFKRKIFFLYLRGKINHRTYQRLRDGKGTPKTALQANLKYATHQISKKQRDYVVRLLDRKQKVDAQRQHIQAKKQTEILLQQKRETKRQQEEKQLEPKITVTRESEKPKINIERERERER